MRSARVFTIIALLSVAPVCAAFAQGAPTGAGPGGPAVTGPGAPSVAEPARPTPPKVIAKPAKVKRPIHHPRPHKPVVHPKRPPPPVAEPMPPRP